MAGSLGVRDYVEVVDAHGIVHLPFAPSPDLDGLLGELFTAIDLVASGRAVRVIVSNLPPVDAVIARALARAHASHVDFTVERSPSGSVCVRVSPGRP